MPLRSNRGRTRPFRYRSPDPTVEMEEAEACAYRALVCEAKQILANEEKGALRLGELADQVETKYGQRTLAAFAREIDKAICTVERHRDVFRAWKDEIHAPGRELPDLKYSVARELATHPNRADIVRDNPAITKAQATDKMRNWKRVNQPHDRSAAARRVRSESKLQKWVEGFPSRAERSLGDAQLHGDWSRYIGALDRAAALELANKARDAWAGVCEHLEALCEPPQSPVPRRRSRAAELEAAAPAA